MKLMPPGGRHANPDGFWWEIWRKKKCNAGAAAIESNFIYVSNASIDAAFSVGLYLC
ncbi:hypothetical protein [Noviherbaspirillum sedimenti]|uniref:hypothetical protein n=1 Tax=Noviherbaspirillum sedimenti TaxID=2320865 RepID=UPI0013144BB6|nr:hypothetical protein [Noviherbaspirillum sedimenti]